MTTESALSELAVDIALEAGALAAQRHKEGVRIAATKSGLADIVTEADREVETLIRSRLERERPGDGFLGEESGAAESTTGLTWVVDPIDGTVNYAYGIPGYAVSIAVVAGEPDPSEWTALAGVVHNPATGDLFRAAKGEGAYLGDRRITVSPAPDAAGALIGTGFAYDPAQRARQFEVLARLMPLARDMRRFGAAALDLAAVAAGRLDVYYESGLWPWDQAAGVLLVEEAGGVVGGVDGARPTRDLLIAAAPDFWPVFAAALADASA